MSGVVGGTMGVEKGGEWSAKEAGQRKRGGTLVDVTGRAKRETKGGRGQNSRMGYWDRDEVVGGGQNKMIGYWGQGQGREEGTMLKQDEDLLGQGGGRGETNWRNGDEAGERKIGGSGRRQRREKLEEQGRGSGEKNWRNGDEAGERKIGGTGTRQGREKLEERG